MFFSKKIDQQHIEVVCKGKDQDEDTDIAGDRIDQLRRAPDLFPASEFEKSIAHIKEVISDEQDVIGGIRKTGVAPVHLQDKYPAIPVKHPAQPVDNINHQHEVNDIGYYITVHDPDVLRLTAFCFVTQR